jgi:thiamine-phosphate pyrophosphorylase
MIPRFYPILDTGAVAARGLDVVDTAQAILDGGARILQFRHKASLSREAYGWLESIAQRVRDAGALLVVNDRADLAALFDAALHLGQDDLPPTAARTIVPNAIVGFSTHTDAQLRAAAAEPVDYLALGPIFGTSTKLNPDASVGLEELRRLRPLTTRPLVAIGGIALANAASVIEAGADSVAVIADLFPSDRNITKRVRQWLEL